MEIEYTGMASGDNSLSIPDNPLPPPIPPPNGMESPAPHAPALDEDPPFTGWDVLQIAVLLVVSILVFLFVTAAVAHSLFYRRVPFVNVAQIPMLAVMAQLLAYFLVLAFMVSLVKRDPNQSFWRAIRWNWPKNWIVFLFGGGVMALVLLQGVARFLPMPKDMPINHMFTNASDAWALSVFGTTLAPLMEELFFRGFLYPVLARRIGMIWSVLLTALGFSLIHAPQLGRAWGPVLVIFLVGLILTITRALTKSVAVTVLLHVGYNSAIFGSLLIVTGGFRHLEMLSQ